MQTKITESKGVFSVAVKGLTKGQVMALRNALAIGGFASPLARELLDSLTFATESSMLDLGSPPVVTELKCR